MDFDETNILDRNMKRIKAQGEGSKDEGGGLEVVAGDADWL